MKKNTENRSLPARMESIKMISNSKKSKLNLNTEKDEKDKINKIPEEIPEIKKSKDFDKNEGATIRFAMTMFQYEP